MQELEQAIRERAYHLWVADGYNSGNADAHWLTAQREVLASSLGSLVAAAPLAAKPAAKKKAKAAAPKTTETKTTETKTTTTKRKSKAA